MEDTPQNRVNVEQGSVAWLLHQSALIDDTGFAALCHAYFPRLRALAARTLGALPGANAEADDVVQSALRSFCARAARHTPGSAPDLHGAWGLMCRIVVCKSRRRHSRQARGKPGARLNPFSDFGAGEGPEFLEQIGEESTAEVDAIVSEVLESLDSTLQAVALLMLENWDNEEMATKLNCSIRTINRKVDLVRQVFKTHFSD